MDLNHMYRMFDDSQSLNKCKVSLRNGELWKKFHELETEMIITKTGRRLFPSIQVQISELDPHAHYCILLEMTPATHCRYKYSSTTGWAPAGPEEAQSPQRMYLHPDSPATGEYWMSQPISFGRLKLTNTTAPPMGHVVLSSMHKYQPRIVISKTSDANAIAWAPSSSVVFPETQFIAVTAYQNEKITKLKIDNNPFAKGFRVNGQSKSKRKRPEDVPEDEEKSAKAIKTDAVSPLRVDDDNSSTCSSGSELASPVGASSNQSYSTTYNPSYPTYMPTHHQQHLPYPYAYYPPYYSPLSMWGYPRPYVYHHPPSTTEKLTPREIPAVEKPKKLTDFSIRAITGLS